MAAEQPSIVAQGNTAGESITANRPAIHTSPIIARGSTAIPSLTSTTPVSGKSSAPSDAELKIAKSNLRPQAPEFLPEVNQKDPQQQGTMITISADAVATDGIAAMAAAIPLPDTPITGLSSAISPREKMELKQKENGNGNMGNVEMYEQAISGNHDAFSTVMDSPNLGSCTQRRAVTPATPPPINAQSQGELDGRMALPIVKNEDSPIPVDLDPVEIKHFGSVVPIMSSNPTATAVVYAHSPLINSNDGFPQGQSHQRSAYYDGLTVSQEPSGSKGRGTHPYPFSEGRTLLSSGDDPVSEGRRIYLGNLDYNTSRYEVKMLLRHQGVYRTVEKIYMPFQDPNSEREVSSMETSLYGGNPNFHPPSGRSGHFHSGGGYSQNQPHCDQRSSPYFDFDMGNGGEPDIDGNIAMKNKGFVFVTYMRASEADEALSRLNGVMHRGRRLVCRPGLPKGVSFRVNPQTHWSDSKNDEGDNSGGDLMYSSHYGRRGGVSIGGDGLYGSSFNRTYVRGGHDALHQYPTRDFGDYNGYSSSGYRSGIIYSDSRVGSGGGYNSNSDEQSQALYGSDDIGFSRGRMQQQYCHQKLTSQGYDLHGSDVPVTGADGGHGGRSGFHSRPGAPELDPEFQTHRFKPQWMIDELHAGHGPGGMNGNTGGPLTHGFTTYKFKALGVADAGGAGRNNSMDPGGSFHPGYPEDAAGESLESCRLQGHPGVPT